MDLESKRLAAYATVIRHCRGDLSFEGLMRAFPVPVSSAHPFMAALELLTPVCRCLIHFNLNPELSDWNLCLWRHLGCARCNRFWGAYIYTRQAVNTRHNGDYAGDLAVYYVCRACIGSFLDECEAFWQKYLALHLCWVQAGLPLSAVPREIMRRYFGLGGALAWVAYWAR
jgi:hypothetical protein